MGEKNTGKIITLDDRIAKLESLVKEKENEVAKKLASSGSKIVHPVVGNKSNSLEQKIMQSFGVNNAKSLIGVNTASARYSHVPLEYRAAVKSFKEAVDISRYVAQMFYHDPLDKGEYGENKDGRALKHIYESHWAKEVLVPMVKAFSTGVADDGGAWIPTAISSMWIEEFELERRVLAAFREVPMPTNPYKISVQKNVTTARKIAESTPMTGSNFQTTTIDFDATKLGEYYPLPEELNEDSAPPMLAIARAEVGEAQLRALETAAINGDADGTHQDDDTEAGAADLAEKAVDGLRKRALANSANGSVVTFSSAVTTAKLDEMRKASGKFGINVRDLAYMFSPAGYHQAVSLDEVTSVEKFGPAATILSGALAAFRGIEVMISEFIRDDLSASGVNTLAGPNTKTTVLLVNKKRFMWGRRRPIRVRVQMNLPDQDQWMLASYQRVDFQGHEQSASEVSCVVGIDVTP